VTSTPLLEVRDLTKTYASGRSIPWRRRPPDGAPALAGASFDVLPSEAIGVVGESGSGKSTLGYCIVGLIRPSSGEVAYRGKVVSTGKHKTRPPAVRGVQIVFQDPYSSLNPRRTVGSILREILRVHRLRSGPAIAERVDELLESVGLSRSVADSPPRQLSGGQRQRVGIARALALEPELLVADEVVSALDASIQAQILNLLADLRAQLNLTLIFISHDLAVVRQLCDRLIVMREGQIVETGSTVEVLRAPRHPYTRTLLAAIPRLEPVAEQA
jgi:ABC-type oligopeptide transport system ATPase subunit